MVGHDIPLNQGCLKPVTIDVRLVLLMLVCCEISVTAGGEGGEASLCLICFIMPRFIDPQGLAALALGRCGRCGRKRADVAACLRRHFEGL